MRVIAAVVLLALAGCRYIPGTEASKIAEGESQVRDALADPNSAEFRNLSIREVTGAVCGEVNAKNRMGGFVGFTRFYVLPGFVRFEDGDLGTDTVPVDFDRLHDDFCGKRH